METFMNEDFLLTTETAKNLFHYHAEKSPIIDYHTHLDPKDICSRRRFNNIAELWLEADHYKWRVMRACGISEHYVTGAASDREKFMRYAEIMPRLIGNPLYHWTHLELRRYFGIDKPLSKDTSEEVWDTTVGILNDGSHDAAALLSVMKIKALCTTDDPADDLLWHKQLTEKAELSFMVLPSFRPDRFLNIHKEGWKIALEQLGEKYGEIIDMDSLKKALSASLDSFCALGCRASDHGFLTFRYSSENSSENIIKKALDGEWLSDKEIACYQGELLRFLAMEYARRDIVMQLHLGPVRNNSRKLMMEIGYDAGGDSIGCATDPDQLAALLGDLEAMQRLPRTILYGLNPCDNAMLATMAVNFASDGAKIQYGAAWWFQDNIRGITNQLNELMETGLLAGSVGMLTDSRSFTSFVRHEYYRRILCNKLGELVESGQYPSSIDELGIITENICWKNAMRFFRMDC